MLRTFQSWGGKGFWSSVKVTAGIVVAFVDKVVQGRVLKEYFRTGGLQGGGKIEELWAVYFGIPGVVSVFDGCLEIRHNVGDVKEELDESLTELASSAELVHS